MSPFQDGSMAEGWLLASLPGMGTRLVSFLAYRCWRNTYAEQTDHFRRFRQVTLAGYKKTGPKSKRAEER